MSGVTETNNGSSPSTSTHNSPTNIAPNTSPLHLSPNLNQPPVHVHHPHSPLLNSSPQRRPLQQSPSKSGSSPSFARKNQTNNNNTFTNYNNHRKSNNNNYTNFNNNNNNNNNRKDYQRQGQHMYTPPHRQYSIDNKQPQPINEISKDLHIQKRTNQTREVEELDDKATSDILFSLAVRSDFTPFKLESTAVTWMQNIMIESGDIVDNLLKNPQAVWDICKRAPQSILVMDSLLTLLGSSKLYETVKLSKLNQLLHGILRATGLMHKGIKHYLTTKELTPSMFSNVVNFYFAVLPYLTTEECKGIPIESMWSFEYARGDIDELRQLANKQVNEASIRTIDVLPTSEEITSGPPYPVTQNIVDGVWPNFETYMRTHFTLLREDFTNPLREVLNAVRANVSSKSHPWIMRNVKAENLVILPSNAAEVGMQVSFKLQRRVVNWDSFDHFKLGELVCLNEEGSDRWIFAIVMFTDLSVIRRGYLTIKFLRESDLKEFDWEKEYTMVESPNFFGAVRPVLKRLQVIRDEHIPMLPVLLKGGVSVAPPTYLEMEPLVDIASLYENLKEITGKTEFNLLERWPDQDLFPNLRTILDPSQFIAMKHMMLNKLAIVQGPPGTGKSFVGVKAVQLIANSLRKHRDAFRLFQQHHRDTLTTLKIKQILEVQEKHMRLGPILVICYTNHALDQFLTDILLHIPDLVRVGGRSRSTDEKLAKRNLANLLLQPVIIPFTKNHLRRLIKIRKNQEKLLSLLWHCYKQPNDYLPKVLPENFRKQLDTTNEGVDNLADMFKVWQSGNVPVPKETPPVKVESPSSSIGSASSEEIIETVETQEDIEYEKQREMRVKMLFEQYSKNAIEGDWEVFEKSKKHWEEKSLNGILPVKPMPGFTPDSMLDQRRRIDELTMNDEDEEIGLDSSNEMENEEEEVDDEKINADVDINCLEEVRATVEAALEGWEREIGEGVENVWQMEVENRRNFWAIVVAKAKSELRAQIDATSAKFNRISQEFQELRDQKRLAILREAPLVGMTSTQAASLSSLLHALAPSVLVVEESAELLEAQLLSCIVPSIQHLILIGDHQQLRPKVSDYDSEIKYDLHISMYERLLRLGVPKSTLNRQVRMRPAIADIMRLPDFYPGLQDHPLVTRYPHVRGMSHDVFFVNHHFMEDGEDDVTVKKNTFEANYAYRLARYLMLQGYLPNEITLLTPYVGQFREICNLFHADRTTSMPKVITIDDYQGEENKIIILSLVRSNINGILGFTKVTNRMIVGLSRAKHGLYILGNGDMLAHHNKHWNQVVTLLKHARAFGDHLFLTCQKHPSNTLRVSSVDDFKMVNSFGGCFQECDELLPCGHRCTLKCHPSDHSGLPCKQACTRRQDCGHPCTALCFEECPPCGEKLIRLLPCGHRQESECGQLSIGTMCKAPCKEMLMCGHRCSYECGAVPCPPCKHRLKTNLECGHVVEYTCGTQPRCRKPCDFVHPCGHPCIGNCTSCYYHHIPCTEPCGRTLLCGHACTGRCGRPCVCSQLCENFCAHYKCTHKCEEVCAPCVDACAWVCAHYACSRPCYQMCDRPLCNKRCRKLLSCRHQCRGLCGELCPPCPLCEPYHEDTITNRLIGDIREPELLFKLHRCGHVFSLDSIEKWMFSLKKANRIAVSQKVCPTCEEPIHYSLRYGNILKNQRVHIENMKNKWKQVSATFNPAFEMPTIHGYSAENCFICPNGHPYFLGDSNDSQKISKCPDCGVNLSGT